MSLEVTTNQNGFVEIDINPSSAEVATLLVYNSVAAANAAIPSAARRLGYPIIIALPTPVMYAYIGGILNADLKPLKGFLSCVMQVTTSAGNVSTTVVRDEGLGITGLTRTGVGLYDYTGTFVPDANTIVVPFNNEATVFFNSPNADIEIQLFDENSLSSAPSDLGFVAGGLIEIRKYL